jgi:hypothetical protein
MCVRDREINFHSSIISANVPSSHLKFFEQYVEMDHYFMKRHENPNHLSLEKFQRIKRQHKSVGYIERFNKHTETQSVIP